MWLLCADVRQTPLHGHFALHSQHSSLNSIAAVKDEATNLLNRYLLGVVRGASNFILYLAQIPDPSSSRDVSAFFAVKRSARYLCLDLQNYGTRPSPS